MGKNRHLAVPKNVRSNKTNRILKKVNGTLPTGVGLRYRKNPSYTCYANIVNIEVVKNGKCIFTSDSEDAVIKFLNKDFFGSVECAETVERKKDTKMSRKKEYIRDLNGETSTTVTNRFRRNLYAKYGEPRGDARVIFAFPKGNDVGAWSESTVNATFIIDNERHCTYRSFEDAERAYRQYNVEGKMPDKTSKFISPVRYRDKDAIKQSVLDQDPSDFINAYAKRLFEKYDGPNKGRVNFKIKFPYGKDSNKWIDSTVDAELIVDGDAGGVKFNSLNDMERSYSRIVSGVYSLPSTTSSEVPKPIATSDGLESRIRLAIEMISKGKIMAEEGNRLKMEGEKTLSDIYSKMGIFQK